MKKIFMTIMVLALIVFAAACSGAPASANNDSTIGKPMDQPVEESAEPSEEPTEPSEEPSAPSAEPTEQPEEPSEEPPAEPSEQPEEPSEEPSEEPVKTEKETAYKKGKTKILANDGFYDYEIEFKDGEITAAYLESDEGKGGWGGDSGNDIKNFRYYGMTVEEVKEKLENENYTVKIK